jgi:hypothetical protein
VHATSPHFHGPPIAPASPGILQKSTSISMLFCFASVRSLRYSKCFRFSFAKPPAFQSIPLPRRRNSDFVAFLHLAARLPFRKEPPAARPPPLRPFLSPPFSSPCRERPSLPALAPSVVPDTGLCSLPRAHIVSPLPPPPAAAAGGAAPYLSPSQTPSCCAAPPFFLSNHLLFHLVPSPVSISFSSLSFLL